MDMALKLDGLLVAKGFFVLSLGSWLLLAAFNNIVDQTTNVTLLNRMLRMEGLLKDHELGLGLRPRLMKSSLLANGLIKCISSVQFLVAFFLIGTGLVFLSLAMGSAVMPEHLATTMATLALLCFASIWAFFLIGGLWFGYWIKMGNIQMTHFTLLILSLLSVILVNLGNGNQCI